MFYVMVVIVAASNFYIVIVARDLFICSANKIFMFQKLQANVSRMI
jgi:hypothetical protein